MKNITKKKMLLTTLPVFCLCAVLVFVPHRTCGCGQYEDGSYLTHAVNTVSEAIIGKTLIEKNPSPWK